MKQYMILTIDPALGGKDWIAQGGIGFSTIGSAEQSKRGTIESLQHANANLNDRSWAIIEVDFSKMVAGSRASFFERLRWAYKYVTSGYKFTEVGLSRKDFEAWKRASAKED